MLKYIPMWRGPMEGPGPKIGCQRGPIIPREIVRL